MDGLIGTGQGGTILRGNLQEERRRKDEAVKASVLQKLVETGEKERLKDTLREKLVQCGWRDELKEHCREVIRQKVRERESESWLSSNSLLLVPVVVITLVHWCDFIVKCCVKSNSSHVGNAVQRSQEGRRGCISVSTPHSEGSNY